MYRERKGGGNINKQSGKYLLLRIKSLLNKTEGIERVRKLRVIGRVWNNKYIDKKRKRDGM